MNEAFEKVWAAFCGGAGRAALPGRLEIERARGDAAFDGDVKVGEIRIFADVARPFVALIAEDCGAAGRLIVPVSPFAVPASSRELMVGPRVYQLWNAFTASRSFTDRSWIVDTVTGIDLEEIRLKVSSAHPGRIEGEGVVGDYERAFLVSAPWGLMLAAGGGALLGGLGVIALFAANVFSVGRLARVGLSALPIAACGVAALVGALRRAKSSFFWEPLAILWTLAVGAGVATVSQTYQLTDEMRVLWLALGWLALPILGVTRSVVLALVLPLAYTAFARESAGLFLVTLAASAWVYADFLRRRPPRAALMTAQVVSAFAVLGCFGTAVRMPFEVEVTTSYLINVAICVGLMLAGHSWLLPLWSFMGRVLAVFVSLPVCWLWDGFGFATNPFVCIGSPLALAVALVVWGLRKLEVATFDLGAFLLLNLIVGRFFSPTWSFLAKAGVLAGCGLALVGATVALLIWKKRRAA